MKVCFPNFGSVGIVLETLCRQENIQYTPPQAELEEALAIGARLSPEGVCLPMKRMLGEFVLAAREGADTALFLGGSGPCRFGYFAPMMQTILEQQGIAMRVLSMEAPEGSRLQFIKDLSRLLRCSEARTARLLLKGWRAMQWLDRWEAQRLRVIAQTGQRPPKAEAEGSFSLLTAKLQERCRAWQLKTPLQDLLRVGIVGDIYSTVDPLINHGLQERLAEMGVLTRRSIELSSYLLHLLTGNRAQNKAAKPYLARGIGGFAQETIGASQQMLAEGFDGLIQVYPLSCMPEIVADGILAGMQQDTPIPVLRLVLDEHSGQAGNQTRLEAFADMLKRRRKAG